MTLFQYGRTINCACGRRVGFEHKIERARGEEIKFFADVMAARLVKWLRAIGSDTVWEARIEDGKLVRRAIRERRFVLTLDKKLRDEWRADNIFLLDSEDVFEQIGEVIERFGIERPVRLFTRCLVCNAILRPATARQISGRLPAGVIRAHNEFRLCPRCDRIFWEGSHTDRMRKTIDRIFDR